MPSRSIPATNRDDAKRLRTLEDMLFVRGAMEEAPCFCCGYNGPGYYNQDLHPCAKRHHLLRRVTACAA